MKTLIAALLLVSASAFAQNLTSTEALLRTIPAGEYRGQTPEGGYCEVAIRNLFGKVAVVATNDSITKRSEVLEGSNYRWNPANRSFLSSVYTTTLSGSTENVFRTIAVTQNTQYVVVADIFTNNRDVSESKVECVINL